MPESAPSNKVRTEALKNKVIESLNPFREKEEIGLPMSNEASHIAEAMGGRIIGQGAERVAIERPDGKILGIYRYPLRDGAPKLKQQFYTSRILNTLFPQFYPHVYAAGFSSSVPEEFQVALPLLQKLFPEYVLSFSVTEKIQCDGSRADRAVPDKEGEYPSHSYPETRMILDKLDIDLFTDDEPGKNNVGGVYTDGTSVLDGLDPDEAVPTLSEEEKNSWHTQIKNLYSGSMRSKVPLSATNRDKLLAWMREEHYSDDAIRTVESSFNRLLELRAGS